MAGIQHIGFTSANVAEVDSNRNTLTAEGLPAHPSAGGWYSVTGYPAAIVAAALAADVSLVSMRFAAGSTRKAYLSRFQFVMSPATLGAAAGVGGAIGLQRFTTATPTGGTARTPNEMGQVLTTATDMTDVRDNNAALTVTSVVFGAEIAATRVPLFVANAGGYMWEFNPNLVLGYPLVFEPGDGMVLRTRVALAATQTWVFSWGATWYEK